VITRSAGVVVAAVTLAAGTGFLQSVATNDAIYLQKCQ
jgi:hypothetical protein